MGRNLQEQLAQAGQGPIVCTSKQTQDQTNVDLTTEGAGAKHSGHYTTLGVRARIMFLSRLWVGRAPGLCPSGGTFMINKREVSKAGGTII